MPVGTRRKMRNFKLVEISAVDFPAQEHAQMTIMKRKYSPATEVVAKSYIDPANGAVPFSTVLYECLERDRFYELQSKYSNQLNALDTSLRSIVGDAEIDGPTKGIMLRNSVEEFLAAVRGQFSDVEPALHKALSEQGVKEMADAAELQKQIDKLTKDLADATAAQKAASEAHIAELKAAKDKAEEAEAARKHAENVAKLSAEEKAHLETLADDKAKVAFAALPAEKRGAEVTKARSGDETIAFKGQTISKRAVGDAQFSVFKAMAEEIEESNKKAENERKAAAEAVEKREVAEFETKADTEYGQLPGEKVVKGKALRAISKMDKETSEAVVTMLKAGQEAIALGFKNFGNRGGKNPPGGADFAKRVADVQAANPKLSKQAAMQKARRDYPADFAAQQAADAASTH